MLTFAEAGLFHQYGALWFPDRLFRQARFTILFVCGVFSFVQRGNGGNTQRAVLAYCIVRLAHLQLG